MKTLQIYLADLKELLTGRDFVSARTCLKAIGPIDLADGWEHFSPDERAAIFRLSTRQKAMQLFEELDPPEQAALLESLQKDQAEELLSDLDPVKTSRLMRGLPAPMARKLASIMKKGAHEWVQEYMRYPDQSVGALMRGRYVTLDEKWPSKTALDRVQHSTRLRRIEETHLDTLMVVDADHRLKGVAGLKSLVVAPNDMTVRDLMDPAPRTLPPEADQEDAVKLFQRYRLKSIPVVREDGTLVGVVVYKDIFQIAHEETEEDFAKMAGMGHRLSLARMPEWRQAALRLPWLVITAFGGALVSGVIHNFEGTLSKVIALASFSPLIAGMGGNVGSQTATIIVRGLATGEIRPGDESRTVVKETAVGLMLGSFYALVVGGLAWFVYGERYGWRFGFVVAISMLFSMTFASFMASMEPFILRRLGTDPATATGPMITTTTDILSNLFYFTLATKLLLQ